MPVLSLLCAPPKLHAFGRALSACQFSLHEVQENGLMVGGLLRGLALLSRASWCILQRAPRERFQLIQCLAICVLPAALCKPLVICSNQIAGTTVKVGGQVESGLAVRPGRGVDTRSAGTTCSPWARLANAGKRAPHYEAARRNPIAVHCAVCISRTCCAKTRDDARVRARHLLAGRSTWSPS